MIKILGSLTEANVLEILDLFGNPIAKRSKSTTIALNMLANFIKDSRHLGSLWLMNTGVNVEI